MSRSYRDNINAFPSRHGRDGLGEFTSSKTPVSKQKERRVLPPAGCVHFSKTLLSHQKVQKALPPVGCVRPTMPDRVEVSTKVGSRLARLVGEARRVKDGFFQKHNKLCLRTIVPLKPVISTFRLKEIYCLQLRLY